jgi:hypothetical protein
MTAGRPRQELLELEVSELTDLLRTDDSFSNLRSLLVLKRLDPHQTVLAGLIDGEDESRYGVFLTADDECIVFEIDSSRTLVRWEVVDNLDSLAGSFSAVGVAVMMRQAGRL